MKWHVFLARFLFAASCLAAGVVGGQSTPVPPLLNYQGRVQVSGSDFTGTGQFKFALVNSAGSQTFWSNDGTSTAGSEPAAAVSVAVNTGNYSVLLGDAALPNMTAIPASVFTASDVRLRVWFNDGTNGFQQLAPDQRIASVGYAMMARDVSDGSITSSKLAANLTVALTNAGNTFVGSFTGTGAGLTGVNADSLNGRGSQTFATNAAYLLIEIEGPGRGTVASSPSGVNATNTIVAAFTPGTTVTLNATPDGNSLFAGWSGAYNGTGACVLTLGSGFTTVRASFQQRTYTLTVTRAGPGYVSSDPGGLDCGAVCSASLPAGTVVTLTATPEPGATFAGWSGASSGASTLLFLVMDGAKAVNALFSGLPTYTGTFTGDGAGLTNLSVTAGPQGPQGLRGLTFQGDWNAASNYVADDAVFYIGSSWLARRANQNVTPAQGLDWTLLAQQGVQGAQGLPGLTGPQGMQGLQGPRGLTFQGNWNAASNYVADGAVFYNGSSWLALRANQNVTPAQGLDWTILAQQGAQGAQGLPGPTGPQGAQGLQGPNTTTANTLYIGPDQDANESSSSLSFGTDNTVWMTLLQGGNVGIGTASPAALLHVNGTVRATAFESTGAALTLGTADSQPLDLRVNGQRALRLEPNATSPNVLGGHSANVVSNGFVGAAILGGGSSGSPNRVGGSYATVVGGLGNTASGDYSIAMGYQTTASGLRSMAMGYQTSASGAVATAMGASTIASGTDSTAMGVGTAASGNYSIAMGYQTTASGQSSTAMGYQTTASGSFSTAVGTSTSATNTHTLAAGRRAKAYHQGAFVWADSTDADFASTANNQFLIRASGGVGIGKTNPATALDVNGTVRAAAFESSGAALTFGTTDNQPLDLRVNGVRALRLEPNATSPNVIGGYSGNVVSNGFVGAAIVGGGGSGGPNRAGADHSTVVGGYGNTASGTYSTAMGYDTLASGSRSTAIGYQTIASGFASTTMGASTTASGNFSTAMGHSTSATNLYTLAAGRRAKAHHQGALVWADSTDADFASTANDQFLIRASGGVGIGTSSPGALLSVSGSGKTTGGVSGFNEVIAHFETTNANHSAISVDAATGRDAVLYLAENGEARWSIRHDSSDSGELDMRYLHSGGGTTEALRLATNGNLTTSGTVNGTSDRNAKQNFAPVDARAVLERVAGLPIQTWSYRASPGERHIGPVSQDFHAAFQVGTDERHISMVDADGVALAAIQGLNQLVMEKEARIESLEKRLADLEALLRQPDLRKDIPSHAQP